MDRPSLVTADLLLDLWRQACVRAQHGDATERLLARLANVFDARIVVRWRDPSQGTVAVLELRDGQVVPWRDEDTSPDAAPGSNALRSPTAQDPARGAFDAAPLPAGSVRHWSGPLSIHAEGVGEWSIQGPRAAEWWIDLEPALGDLSAVVAAAVDNDRRARGLAQQQARTEADNQTLLASLGRADLSETIIGASRGLRAVMHRVALVARTNVPVLLLGETGAGKEVIARAVHSRSKRASGPFLRVNCGAIAPELVDSELFGHERGSFTGALALRQGWFERAHNGTLFLDECGELSLPAQVRLLRVLQDGSLQRVGGERQIHVDVRVIAATHRDLESMVAEGRFREDLWYRLAVFPVRLPPLRERTDDIPALAAHFARAAAKRFGLPASQVMDEDLALLQAYDWPGNVRELISVIERAALLGEGKGLAVAAALGAVEPRLRSRVRRLPAEEEEEGESGFSTLDQAMARHIEAALERSRGRIEGTRGAAELLGINPHTLRARMRRLDIDWQRFRGPAA